MTVAIILGVVVAVIGFTGILITAFRESSSQGLLCLFVPLYQIYYAIKRWSNTKKPFIIQLVGAVIVVVGIVGGTSGFGPLIQDFMEAGAAGDVQAAYACWSTGAATEQQIRDFIENRRDMFEGYKGLSISGRSVQSTGGITRGEARGAISYADGRKLPFTARLVKEHGVWKLTSINIGF